MQCGHFPFTLVEILDSAAYDDEISSLSKKFEIEMDEIYGSAPAKRPQARK